MVPWYISKYYSTTVWYLGTIIVIFFLGNTMAVFQKTIKLVDTWISKNAHILPSMCDGISHIAETILNVITANTINKPIKDHSAMIDSRTLLSHIDPKFCSWIISLSLIGSTVFVDPCDGQKHLRWQTWASHLISYFRADGSAKNDPQCIGQNDIRCQILWHKCTGLYIIHNVLLWHQPHSNLKHSEGRITTKCGPD